MLYPSMQTPRPGDWTKALAHGSGVQRIPAVAGITFTPRTTRRSPGAMKLPANGDGVSAFFTQILLTKTGVRAAWLGGGLFENLCHQIPAGAAEVAAAPGTPRLSIGQTLPIVMAAESTAARIAYRQAAVSFALHVNQI
jgi:hypothetical protein